MRALLTVSNLALVLAFAAFVLSVLRPTNRTGHLLGLYVVCWADVVLVLQLAGLLNSLTPQFVLVLQLLLTVSGAILWLRAGRPRLLGQFTGFRVGGVARDPKSILKLISLVLLAGAVAYVYLRQAELTLAVVPNNYDALTYHLSRVGYWLQYHSLYPWPTINPRQITFPMNAELGVLWTVLWTRSDRLSGFVQWLSVPAIILAVYGLARLLGYSRWSSAMTGLLWATLTQVVFQSATNQNDLVTTSFWIAAVFFLVAGLREGRTVHYAVSGVAFGLAIGTKSTSLLVLPGFGLGALIILLSNWRKHGFPRSFASWTAACVLGFLAFGSYSYVQSLVSFGHPWEPWGDGPGLAAVEPEGGTSPFSGRLRDNLGRYAIQLVDLSPLPGKFASAANPTKAAIFTKLFQWLGIRVEATGEADPYDLHIQYINPLNEDTSWFGPLAIFLLAAMVVQAWTALRQREAVRPALLVTGLGFAVVQSALQMWTPYKGRYYLIPVSVLFPLMACLIQSRPALRLVLALGLAALGLTAMLTVTFSIPALKEIRWRDAFSPSRQMIDWPDDFEYRLLMNNIPTAASIGLTGGGNFRDYPFFGENFTHRVTLAVTEDSYVPRHVDTERFMSDFWHSDYLYLRTDLAGSLLPTTRASFGLLGEDGTYSAWMRRDLRPPDDCEQDKWPFRDFFQVAPESPVCPRFPFIPATASSVGALSVPEGDFVPIINSSDHGSMQFDLLAKKATRARISVRVDPQGFVNPQTLRLTFLQAGSEPEVFEAIFTKKGVLRFAVPLTQGLHTAEIGLEGGSEEVRVLGVEVERP